MKTKINRLFLSAVLMMFCSAVSFAGTGTGTAKEPYSGFWETLELAKIIKAGDTISLDCTIGTNKPGYQGGSVTMCDAKLSQEVKVFRDWANWNVIGCLKDPYDNYKDYVAYNSDWEKHAFVVTKVELTTAFGHKCLYITGNFTGYYNKDEYITELDKVWNALPVADKDVDLTTWYNSMCNAITTASTQSQAQESFLETLNSILDKKAIPDAIAQINALIKDETNADLLATAQKYIDNLNNDQFHRINEITNLTDGFTELHTAIMSAVSDIRDIEASASTEITEAEEYINKLKACTTVEQANTIADEAVLLLTRFAAYSNAGYYAAFGDMGTEQKGCPAVKVTKGGKTIILYNPEEVELIKIPADK
mgnify:CR=1 FL=1